MSLMNDLGVDEALRQFRSFRDDQFRANLNHDRKLKALETENQELKSRLGVLTRLLISKGVFAAAEIAALIVEIDLEAKAQATIEQTPPVTAASPSAPEEG
ncbi:MAG: hypothetical protein H7062_04810 [Candidatus Saccharimonas sp.]|nr:hypothetical protein [Planctomycetaceae bacterium]